MERPINPVELARYVAIKSFEGKVDKGGSPYFEHLERVSYACQLGDTDSVCIALLHDLLEYCPEWNKESLSVLFNKRVVDAVVCLTKSNGEKYEDYIHRVSKNKDAVQIKMYDLLDNMNITRLDDVTEKDVERIKKYHTAYKFLSR